MFDQLWILWGLPLVLLPVVIHLLNRLRFRSVHWAAMMFLLQATRHSTRQARLRQWLILLFRMLAIACLVLALSQPRVGGWLGLALSGPPDTVLVLLDRSASMEETDPRTRTSRRERALTTLTAALRQFGPRTRLVLLDSAGRRPQELPNPALLPDLPLVQPTDTAADVPALLQAALTYLMDNATGRTEIWLASDLQRTNWRPEAEAWGALTSQFGSLNRSVQFRLLALESDATGNVAVVVKEVRRQRAAGRGELRLAVELQRGEGAPATVPVAVKLGPRPVEQLTATFDGTQTTLQHQCPLDAGDPGGWGRVSLAADANARDNQAWFVYGDDRPLRTRVVGEDGPALHCLAAAARAVSDVSVVKADALTAAELELTALVVWQGPFPEAAAQEPLRRFVEAGGVLVCFPGADTAGEPARLFGHLGWGEAEAAAAGQHFTVAHWDRTQGPLADTVSGWALPVDEVEVYRRRRPQLEGEMLAEFGDDAAFLTRRSVGAGSVVACATLPAAGWSDLHRSLVLVPLLQRLLDEGGRRIGLAKTLTVGAFQPGANEDWQPVADAGGGADPRTDAGVYALGGQLVALNRPAAEDQPAVLSPAEATGRFGNLPCRLLLNKAGETPDALPTAIWRLLLYLLLGAMLAESLLTLPGRQRVKEVADVVG